MVWHDAAAVQPFTEGRYIVYKEYPAIKYYQITIERFGMQYRTFMVDGKRVLKRLRLWNETGLEPQIVRYWMNLPTLETDNVYRNIDAPR